MWIKKTISVIISAEKSENSIFKVIQKLDSTGFVDEILVVGFNLDEMTLSQIERTRARFISQAKPGMGGAIKTGIKNTKADLMIITDAGGSFEGEDISKLLSYSEDFDTVFGSRTHVPLIGRDSGMTLIRRLVDDLFGKTISLIFFSSNLTDVGCVFRLTNSRGWNMVKSSLKRDDDLFLTEWLIAAAKNKVKFIEIPVNFSAPGSKNKKETFLYLANRALKILLLFLKMRIMR